MMTARKLSYEELEARLLETENLIGALRNHEVDVIVGDEQIAVVRLRQAQEALERARDELEQRVVERTTELTEARRFAESIKEQLDSLTEELMMVEERQRRQIAQALHDTVGQSLAFSKRELAQLRQRSPDDMRERLQEVCQQLDEAIKQTRDLTFELSPSTLYSLGLQPALEELAEQFAESEGFRCRVLGPRECGPLSEQMQSLLYRSVREMLVNVAKHAEARNVEITLDRRERDLHIAVQDDGKGFDPAVLDGRGKGGGFGILSVRERLVRVGGAFTVESQAGKGTRVTMVVPVNLG